MGGQICNFHRESILNNCTKSTLYCHLFRKKAKISQTKIIGWVTYFSFGNDIFIIIVVIIIIIIIIIIIVII